MQCTAPSYCAQLSYTVSISIIHCTAQPYSAELYHTVHSSIVQSPALLCSCLQGLFPHCRPPAVNLVVRTQGWGKPQHFLWCLFPCPLQTAVLQVILYCIKR